MSLVEARRPGFWMPTLDSYQTWALLRRWCDLEEADSLGQRQFQERDAHVSHQKPVPPAYGKNAHQHKNEIYGNTVALTPVHSFCSLNLRRVCLSHLGTTLPASWWVSICEAAYKSKVRESWNNGSRDHNWPSSSPPSALRSHHS